MELEQCLNFSLTRAQNIIHQLFKAKLAPYGVTPGQYGVLQCLWDENGLTLKQIAERMYLDSSTVTGILDRMEQKDLIRRCPDPGDRRALSVMLTLKGEELRTPVSQAIEAANQYALQNISTEDGKYLKELLKKLNGKE